MRKVFLLVLVTVSVFFLMVSCGPSEEERQQAELEEQQRIEAEAVAAEERRQGEEERRKAEKEMQRARSVKIGTAYHAWLDQMMSDETVEPRRYYKALKYVSAKGDTLVLGLSIADESEAIKLCNFTLTGWWDRDQYGIAEVRVVLAGGGGTLAESKHLGTGAHVCK